jgi:dipeptidyl aminopeptidase/acylaminoacyl peptidase
MNKKVVLFAASLLLLGGILPAQTPDKSIDTWLVAGPVPVPMPAFEKNNDSLKRILQSEQIDLAFLWPEQDQTISWTSSKKLSWKAQEIQDSVLIIDRQSNADDLQLVICAVYLDAKRWLNPKIRVECTMPFQVYLSGKKVGEKMTSPDSGHTIKKDIKLETGKHVLMIKTLLAKEPVQIKADFINSTEDLIITTQPDRKISLRHILDQPGVSDIDISADGQYIALSMIQRNLTENKDEKWLDIRESQTGKLVRSYRGQTELSSFTWAPQGEQFAFTSTDNGKTTLWISDFREGSSGSFISGLENFGRFSWAPDASFIVYSISEKYQEDKSGLKQLRGMPDRWPTYRDKDFWYKVSIPGGTIQQITGGSFSTDLLDISREDNTLLFYRGIYDYSERPYYRSTLYLVDPVTLEADSLWEGPWLNSALFSPDGTKLLFRGGPSLFDGAGINISGDKIPNDYDTQAYIFELSNKQVKAITRDFNPKIDKAIWQDNQIFFLAEDKDYKSVYAYDTRSGNYHKIESEIEVVGKLVTAARAPIAVISGTGATHPDQVAVINLKNNQSHTVYMPAQEFLAHAKLGKVERWAFTSKYGYEIDGRIYYPPDFDPAQKYPCIIYYYGGTSPVSRDFGGRYPKNFYAANGYVVYVVNPAGTTGYGQEYSALHVNDWGKIAGDQIIEGTKKFLQSHTFVDQDRYLVSQTDIFAAAISHAGISSLSSYWGEGYWGYLYSSVATANSFPWNRRDIYVDQSPLFLADSINTPLLLLHGADDTNVPPGESRQLYAALKLLNKEVELVEVSGQNHWIMDYEKRKRWTKTIIAWFDRWLKDQPEWWDNLYPDK